MSQSPPTVESENKLVEKYEVITEKYFIFDSFNNHIGFKSVEFEAGLIEPKSFFTGEIKPDCLELFNFLQEYKEHYMWCQGSAIEQITEVDRKESRYKHMWLLLDNLVEDSARQYQRLFGLNFLFGMYEVFDVCCDASALQAICWDNLENYKISFLLNLGKKPLLNCFINQPEICLKPNCLYLFPSSFTHQLHLDSTEEIFAIFGGFA